jgi:DNA-binding NarL/FixJ family response regulator
VLGYADATEAEITVVTAGFGPVFDRGLTAFLEDEQGMRVLRYGLDLSELEVAIARESPRVAILGEAALASSSMPRRLQAIQPGIGLIALFHGVSEHDGRQLLAFGITACVAQDAPWSDVSTAVRLASEGKQMFVAAASRAYLRGRGSMALTPREWEVFQLVQTDRTNPEIAQALQIGVETVRSHIQGINRKLGVTRRSDLVSCSGRSGFLRGAPIGS